MLRGLTTMNLVADDLAGARAWYAQVLGVEPYFEREINGSPAYVEFRIGDYQHELGIIDRRFAGGPPGEHGSVVTYWAVDDVDATYARLLELGATAHQEPTPYGPGFVAGSVVDPYGNILGVMFNQHYLDVLAGRTRTGSPESQAAMSSTAS